MFGDKTSAAFAAENSSRRRHNIIIYVRHIILVNIFGFEITKCPQGSGTHYVLRLELGC